MKTPFTKIYVASLITNKDRQKFVTYEMNDLGIDFEFMYGTDFGNINCDFRGNKIEYPQILNGAVADGRDFGCAISHYNCILWAYELGYDSVLVIEDDICLKKSKSLIEQSFANIPEDADFVTWDPRFYYNDDKVKFYNFMHNSVGWYTPYNGEFYFLFGGMMYALLNRKAMELYIENQHNNFCPPDVVPGFFTESETVHLNRYISNMCLCTDHLNIQQNFKVRQPAYQLSYGYLQQQNIDDFYQPEVFHNFSRY